MSNLYEISKAIHEVSQMVDEDGVLLPEAEKAFLNLQMQQEEKFENIGKLLKNIGGESAMLKAEAKRLTDRARVLDNKEKGIKKWIKFVLESKGPKTKIIAGTFTFSLRNSKSVFVEPDAILDKKYLRIKEEFDKTMIKKDLEADIEIKGASIVENSSVQVK